MVVKGVKMKKATNKEQINSIKEKSKLFLADRKNSNNIVDIISSSESEEEDVILATVRAFHRICIQLISQQHMYLAKAPQTEEDLNDLNAGDKYKIWLRERYADIKTRLLELITHTNDNIQELSLCTLMKFVSAEGQTPLRKMGDKHLYFPALLFETIVLALISSEKDLRPLINRFQEFVEYDDVRYYLMKTILKDLKEKSPKVRTGVYLSNVYTLLVQLSLQTDGEERLKQFLAKEPDSSTDLKINTLKEHKKLFTSVWLEFLRSELSLSLYKKVLLVLHDKVMPFMTSPLQLSDFLTTSYNIGGAISLLALNGLFILITKYNLTYPDFYTKLYALFEPGVFHVKYRARFFYLSDLFLKSILTPSYLVAAFVKRLARLSLTSPPGGTTVIIQFIYNLLIRHPSCKVLMHRPDGPTDLASDPYEMEEKDPAKTRALESSLWELRSLEQHYYPGVATEAKRMQFPMPHLETDFGDLLENDHDALMEREAKRKVREWPLTFDLPKGLFGGKDDKMKQFWTI